MMKTDSSHALLDFGSSIILDMWTQYHLNSRTNPRSHHGVSDRCLQQGHKIAKSGTFSEHITFRNPKSPCWSDEQLQSMTHEGTEKKQKTKKLPQYLPQGSGL